MLNNTKTRKMLDNTINAKLKSRDELILSTIHSNHHRVSVAPMLSWTDRHCRYFHRLLTKKAMLYTEMITTGAFIYTNHKYLNYSDLEHPIALQLGGNDPAILAKCAKIAQQNGYDEINLNIGCPSDRVQKGNFGACLMRNGLLVADCIKAMQDNVTIPITVKTRIGVDNDDSYGFLTDFIDKVVTESQCHLFIIHARKACLSGLSTKQNRQIPPLDYSRVYQLKKDFHQLIIVINGGIKSIDEAKQHLRYIDGVMIGRAAYKNPALLTQVDIEFFDQTRHAINPIVAVEEMYPYIEHELKHGTNLSHITRPMLGIFHNIPGTSQWRRYLSENANKKGADVTVVKQALEFITRNKSVIYK